MQDDRVAARSRGRALQLVLGVIVLGAIAYFAFPGFRAYFDRKIEEVGGWNEEARRHDPVGFIDFSIAKLEGNLGKFNDVKRDLAVAKAKLQKQHDDSQGKLAFAAKQLEAFKGAFKEAAGGKGWPVEVAGKGYTEAELKQQVSLLLSQRTSYESVVKQTGDGLADAGKRELEIVARVTESKAKLELLRSQKELVKVAQLTAESERLLGEVHDVLVENEALSAENPVRTVEELMRQEGTSTSPTDAAVDAFLAG